MIHFSGGVFKTSSYILRLKVWVVSQYLGFGNAGGKQIKHILDTDTHATNTGAAATLLCIESDSIYHGTQGSSRSGIWQSSYYVHETEYWYYCVNSGIHQTLIVNPQRAGCPGPQTPSPSDPFSQPVFLIAFRKRLQHLGRAKNLDFVPGVHLQQIPVAADDSAALIRTLVSRTRWSTFISQQFGQHFLGQSLFRCLLAHRLHGIGQSIPCSTTQTLVLLFG
jgi:hypothetical protein